MRMIQNNQMNGWITRYENFNELTSDKKSWLQYVINELPLQKICLFKHDLI